MLWVVDLISERNYGRENRIAELIVCTLGRTSSYRLTQTLMRGNALMDRTITDILIHTINFLAHVQKNCNRRTSEDPLERDPNAPRSSLYS
jgi:hypothetical protein